MTHPHLQVDTLLVFLVKCIATLFPYSFQLSFTRLCLLLIQGRHGGGIQDLLCCEGWHDCLSALKPGKTREMVKGHIKDQFMPFNAFP